MIKRAFTATTVALAGIVALAIPAYADGWQSVSLSTSGGNFSGQIYTDSGSNQFRVIGNVDDSTSYSDCTYVSVKDEWGYQILRKEVCGGNWARIDTGLQSNRGGDDVEIKVCRNRNNWPDDCTTKWYYFT